MIPYFELFPEIGEELKACFAGEDVEIGEVGAYSLNILDPEAEKRARDIADLKRTIKCADIAGANCCVTMAGRPGRTACEPDYRQRLHFQDCRRRGYRVCTR